MVSSMAKWIGKVAVVTGASSGIGAAIVDRLLEKGLIVVGVARRADLIENRAKTCGTRGKLHAVKADFSKEEDILKTFKWIESTVGPVHILINNAGTAKMGSLAETSVEDMRKTFDLNVLALCVATKEAVRMMLDNKINGHIVHINSTFGHQVTTHNWNVYPASKFAVTALTETLRQEISAMGSKIKVTSISPGLVATELTTLNKSLAPEVKNIIEQLPILTPEDVVDCVVFALSTPENVQIHELTVNPL